MSGGWDEWTVGGQLRVGTVICPAIGEGGARINGSSHIEGPSVFGNPTEFPSACATVMIAPLVNEDAGGAKPLLGSLCMGTSNPYALAVSGNAAIFNNLDINGRLHTGGDVIATGEVISRCGGHYLSAKKNFDIPHPTKEGYRLRHTCPEGPSNDVYYRGRVNNRKVIQLPPYWEKLVDETTITVNLTPVGAHQDVIVKRIGNNKVYLQSQGGMPIDCFFHIYGTRTDGERLIPEYEGESPEDYPGDNSQYSISGYHYDVK